MHLFCHGIYYQFQSTVLTGGRDSQSIVSVIAAMFQSTRPRGRTRRESYEKFQPAKLFQSTRPRGRTRPVIFPLASVPICFNPRVLAGGRDQTHCIGLVVGNIVSIHASSREDATSLSAYSSCQSVVSIHASSREDATNPRTVNENVSSFNPRVLAGGRDLWIINDHGDFLFQSTRPRGRTRLPQVFLNLSYKVSIHASSREDATNL